MLSRNCVPWMTVTKHPRIVLEFKHRAASSGYMNLHRTLARHRD